MRYLIVLRGLPASGKSSFIEENGFESYTLSSDKYRLMLSSFVPRIGGYEDMISQKCNKSVWQRLYSDLEFRMKHGEFTIIDATNLRLDTIRKYRKLCKTYDYRMIVVPFDVNEEICIQRDKYRGIYSVGEDVIRKMAQSIEELPNSIKQIEPSFLRYFLFNIYEQIDLSDYNKLHIIGDIHGCYTALEETVKDTDETKDAFIFIGDYFDRGIENNKVFRYIYDRLDKPNFFFLRGNHEVKIESYLHGEDISNTTFYRNTLQQFKNDNITDKMLKTFCHELIPCANVSFKGNNYIVTHGGLTKASSVSVFTADDIFVKGVGEYEDMERICECWKANNHNIVQVFGHRNNNDVPIMVNSTCYNVCGSPEYGGDLKSITIDDVGIHEHYIKNTVFSEEGYYVAISKYPNRFKIDNIKTLIGAFRHNKYVNETKFGDISSFQFSKDAFYEEHWGEYC